MEIYFEEKRDPPGENSIKSVISKKAVRAIKGIETKPNSRIKVLAQSTE